jgi:hypothetical protein
MNDCACKVVDFVEPLHGGIEACVHMFRKTSLQYARARATKLPLA